MSQIQAQPFALTTQQGEYVRITSLIIIIIITVCWFMHSNWTHKLKPNIRLGTFWPAVH